MIPQDDIKLNSKFFKTLKIQGNIMRVYDEGDKGQPTLLLLHGAPHSSEEFRYNVPALREAGYRIVIPDHLGLGESDRPEDVSLYTGYADYERTLAIIDTLGIDKFYVEGGDRGSIPLWMLAAFHPDRVLAMISENVSHLNGFFSAGLDQKRRS
ncbi:alpha/beta fold hydrolase [uncultured Hoeflea sp.]|uniref:alpha/beta fold hydrolase n=1 Tax=uncultured Hoeflea sp. TaxID=538666 RepID=UPI002605BCE7|nr:alpha/beta fold hydrolase [uncultured Hoeflea sp.]